MLRYGTGEGGGMVGEYKGCILSLWKRSVKHEIYML